MFSQWVVLLFVFALLLELEKGVEEDILETRTNKETDKEKMDQGF